jgi:hypothetical protein
LHTERLLSVKRKPEVKGGKPLGKSGVNQRTWFLCEFVALGRGRQSMLPGCGGRDNTQSRILFAKLVGEAMPSRIRLSLSHRFTYRKDDPAAHAANPVLGHLDRHCSACLSFDVLDTDTDTDTDRRKMHCEWGGLYGQGHMGRSSHTGRASHMDRAARGQVRAYLDSSRCAGRSVPNEESVCI